MSDRRGNFIVGLAALVWLALWIGGWVAGGLLVPAYETPASIGALLGFVVGVVVAGSAMWVGGIK